MNTGHSFTAATAAAKMVRSVPSSPRVWTAITVLAVLLFPGCQAQSSSIEKTSDFLRINCGGGNLNPPETVFVWAADETYFRGSTRVMQTTPSETVPGVYKTQRSGTGDNDQWLYYVVPDV